MIAKAICSLRTARFNLLAMILLAVFAYATGSFERALANGHYGEPALPDGMCLEGETNPRYGNMCVQCGNNGEVACSRNGRFAECSESPSGFAPHGGICGRMDVERGDFSIRNCGFPGFPMCPAGTVRCQVGTPDDVSGLCLACGDYGQSCCAPDRECDFGSCVGGICVKNEEPDLSGVWGSSIQFTYEIRQRAGTFTWNVIAPESVQETASGTVDLDANTGKWVVTATWSGSNGSAAATGTVADIEPDGRARRIEWSNGVVFMRDPLSPGVMVPGAPTFEQGFDRMGMDYRNFDLGAADPKLCQIACVGDPNCKAWTYVNPPKQGPKPRCWLKNGIPNKTPDPLCVSGVVRQ